MMDGWMQQADLLGGLFGRFVIVEEVIQFVVIGDGSSTAKFRYRSACFWKPLLRILQHPSDSRGRYSSLKCLALLCMLGLLSSVCVFGEATSQRCCVCSASPF